MQALGHVNNGNPIIFFTVGRKCCLHPLDLFEWPLARNEENLIFCLAGRKKKIIECYIQFDTWAGIKRVSF